MSRMPEKPSALDLRLSEDSALVLDVARKVAKGLNHNYIGTEHILLGLTGCTPGIFNGLNIDTERVEQLIALSIRKGERVADREIDFTPISKTVIGLAIEESRMSNAQEVVPMDILIGLVREGQGIAAGTLAVLEITQKDLPRLRRFKESN